MSLQVAEESTTFTILSWMVSARMEIEMPAARQTASMA